MFCALFLISNFFYGCSNSESPVPQANVDFTISINNAQYSALQNPGGYVYLTGGIRGIFVYCRSINDYYAFDRCCTFNIADSALVFDKKSHCLIHRDTLSNCSSTFSALLQGAVSHGPAKHSLKQYSVSIISEGRLHIYNNDIYGD